MRILLTAGPSKENLTNCFHGIPKFLSKMKFLKCFHNLHNLSDKKYACNLVLTTACLSGKECTTRLTCLLPWIVAVSSNIQVN